MLPWEEQGHSSQLSDIQSVTYKVDFLYLSVKPHAVGLGSKKKEL